MYGILATFAWYRNQTHRLLSTLGVTLWRLANLANLANLAVNSLLFCFLQKDTIRDQT